MARRALVGGQSSGVVLRDANGMEESPSIRSLCCGPWSGHERGGRLLASPSTAPRILLGPLVRAGCCAFLSARVGGRTPSAVVRVLVLLLCALLTLLVSLAIVLNVVMVVICLLMFRSPPDVVIAFSVVPLCVSFRIDSIGMFVLIVIVGIRVARVMVVVCCAR